MALWPAVVPRGCHHPWTGSFLLFLSHPDFVHCVEERKIIIVIKFSSQYITKPEKIQQACPGLLCVLFNPLDRLLAGALAYLLSSRSRYLHSMCPSIPPTQILIFCFIISSLLQYWLAHPVKESLWTPLLICCALLSCFSLRHPAPPLLCLQQNISLATSTIGSVALPPLPLLSLLSFLRVWNQPCVICDLHVFIDFPATLWVYFPTP